MSTPDRALEMLATLSPADRDWILGKLSPDAKSRLMATRTDGAPGGGASEATHSAHAASATAGGTTTASARAERGDSPAALIERLAAADPDMLASVLSGGPGWLVSAILRIHEWPWSKRFLQALPPAIRVEVMQLERHGTSLALPARDLVLRTLVSRLGASWSVAAPATRFEAVLTRLKKVRRA
jgi:hypothetical protein